MILQLFFEDTTHKQSTSEVPTEKDKITTVDGGTTITAGMHHIAIFESFDNMTCQNTVYILLNTLECFLGLPFGKYIQKLESRLIIALERIPEQLKTSDAPITSELSSTRATDTSRFLY